MAAGDAAFVVSLLGTTRFGLGALKSWTLVPLIRGSNVGSITLGNGCSSGAGCAVFLLINKLDIGFFKKGRPRFPLCVSGAAVGPVGSLAILAPVGRFPAMPELCARSVGVANEEGLLFTGVSRDVKPVLIGGGGGFDLEIKFSCAAGSDGCCCC